MSVISQDRSVGSGCSRLATNAIICSVPWTQAAAIAVCIFQWQSPGCRDGPNNGYHGSFIEGGESMAVESGMAVVCIAATALSSLVNVGLGEPKEYLLSFYGTEGDGYINEHHSAYWHGHDCGLPDKVDAVHFGMAAPRWVPLCSRWLVCYDGCCVVATVVDRQRDDIIHGLPHLDLWSAAAEHLGYVGEGIVVGTARQLKH
jgi:hypothetical protein